jgi:sugar phosphate permease
MAKDITKQSTSDLTRRIKAATVVLVICWSAVIVAVAIAFMYGKSPFVLGVSVGIMGLFVVTIAMLIGVKKAKQELARRK